MGTQKQNESEKHSAAPISGGFDYQFFYFLYCLLDLKRGETVGFEIEDDVHIKKQNGNIILIQLKHSVQKNARGEIINLTERDNAIWKTLSTWIDFISNEPNQKSYLEKIRFKLVTNKNENENAFLTKLRSLQSNLITLTALKRYLKELTDSTEESSIAFKINKLNILEDDILELFLRKIDIETNVDSLLDKIKERISYRIFENVERVDLVYDSLYSNIKKEQYMTTCARGKFQISYEDFTSKYRCCFDLGFNKKVLPCRELDLVLPNDVNSQPFIHQLIDIGDIEVDGEERIEYTRQMLQLFNHLKFWEEENLMLGSDRRKFDDNTIALWKNVFRAKHRGIERKISQGEDIQLLESEIKDCALACLDTLRKEYLPILETKLDVGMSNGQLYLLSNEYKIGWHCDWEKKYKK